MKNKILIPISIFLIVIISFYGLSVGVYEVSPYEFLDSSKDDLLGQKTIENNQFVNQVDVSSFVKIDKSILVKHKFFISSILFTKFFDPTISLEPANANFSQFQASLI